MLSYNKSKKTTINIALGCILFNNVKDRVSTYDPATNITSSTFENIGKGSVLKTNIFIVYPITKKWNFSLNSDIRYVSISGIVKGLLIKNKGLMENLNASSGYRFNKGWSLNANLTLNSGGVSSPQGKSNGFTNPSFSIQKDLVKSKLTFSASVSNPFTKYRQNREETLGPDFTQITDDQIYFRSFNISLNYRFGKLKEAIKKNKRGINNDDLSN